ncbi:TonB-dependent receptor [Aliiglaciecola sp. M165]|uniref:TonB-dependent receptor n=1 Tax=Aliiglaciecola sp. M165 TaxID=2593649 RepID=UPI00117CC10A|nr:TonB-dependent receptor [Aliiglaciecola sp. M165]TRY28910.1 TonB-dependent receptor [Aliiglaciecola sp. M165]
MQPTTLYLSAITALTLFSPKLIADEVLTIERLNIVGQRNQPLTQVSEETQKLLDVPGIDGDPLAAVFSLPGIVYAGGDFGGEPAVRGSSPNDNAFYVDNLPTDYIFHLFGDSIFNKNLVRTFDLHAAAFGPQFGNATGGVFDVQLRDPKNQPTQVTLDASFLKTGVMAEGGVTDDQAYYISYRHSLLHLFYKEGEEEDGIRVFNAPKSDDYQGKYQILFGSDHKLTFSINGASDEAGINISEASEEGRIDPDLIGDASVLSSFNNQGVNWEWYIGEHEFLSFVLSHQQLKDNTRYGDDQFSKVDNDQTSFRGLIQSKRFDHHFLSVGVDAQRNDFTYSFDLIPYFCTEHDTNCIDQKGQRIQGRDNIVANLIGLYVTDNISITDDLHLELGLRFDTDDYTDKDFIHPRASLKWSMNSSTELFLSAGSYSRFPDIDTALASIGNPDISPVESKHIAGGFKVEIDDYWQSKVEVYHKSLDNLARAVDINAEDAQLRYTNDLSGSAYGVEWLLEKSLSNDWYGWLSVSWSKSERTDDLTGVTSDYFLDTPWIVNSVIQYQLNERWEIGARLTLRSGAKYTPIIGIKPNPDFPDNNVAVYGGLNSETLPNYVRLDLQADYAFDLYGLDSKLTLALINATGNDNISGYYFLPDGSETPDNFKIESEEGIGVFPSIGLQVNF